MAISHKNILAWFKMHYDKVLAVLALVFLLGSLLYLAVMIGAMHKNKKEFEQEIRSYKPKHPNVDQINTKAFSDALSNIEHPLQLANEQWTNKMMFVPEKRVWCWDGCKKPIPFAATKCPFCNTDQPVPRAEDKTYDSDNDGMPDWWEKKYGLNPLDPSDADKDSDNDGFTNLEEYMAGTDPTDPNSHPPVTAKLRLARIDRDPFKLRFKSVVTLPDGKLSFGLNLRGGEKTYFAKLGEVIKGEGFKVIEYVQKKEEKTISGVGKRMVDVSVLTLQRGDKLIPLVKDQDVQWNEFTAQLLFTVDNSRYVVKIDQLIELKKEKFKVINIDIKNKSVLLESLNDGKRTAVTAIEKFSENRKAVTNDAKKESNMNPVEKRSPAAKQGEDSI